MSATTELERRLTAALDARAALVQPEDLRPAAPPHAGPAHTGPATSRPTTTSEVAPIHPRWRRAGIYAAVAAACAAVIAAPLVLVDDPSDRPDQGLVATPPEGWIGGVGRTGEAAQLQASRMTADVDGDGATDSVWVRSAGGRMGPVRVEVLLSSDPDEVRWTLLDLEAMSAGQEGAVQLDDDPGEELVISSEDGEGFEASVVDLVDGRLQQVPAPPGDPLRSTTLPDGRTRSVRVEGGSLVSWVSQGKLADDAELARVDATWWTIGEVGGERRLVVDDEGEQCIDLIGMRFGACLAGNVPDQDFPEVGGENPSDVVPDFLPVVTRQLDLGQELDFEVAGSPAVARLAGQADSPSLEVEVGGETLTADLGDGDPARLLDGVVPGKAGAGLLVLREAGDATVWSVWSVRGGRLVELTVSDEAPFGSGFLETPDGLKGYRTDLSTSGLLWTAVGDATKASEVREVWTWSLDEGPGVVATGQSCFRFPEDGSDPTFSAC